MGKFLRLSGNVKIANIHLGGLLLRKECVAFFVLIVAVTGFIDIRDI